MNLAVPLTQKNLPAVKSMVSGRVGSKKNLPAVSPSSPDQQAFLPNDPEDITGLSLEDKLALSEKELRATADDISRFRKALGSEIPTGNCFNHLVDDMAAHTISIKLDVQNLEKNSEPTSLAGATNGNHASSVPDKTTEATDKNQKTEQPTSVANKEKTSTEGSKTTTETKKPDPLLALFSLEHQKLNLENAKTEKPK